MYILPKVGEEGSRVKNILAQASRRWWVRESRTYIKKTCLLSKLVWCINGRYAKRESGWSIYIYIIYIYIYTSGSRSLRYTEHPVRISKLSNQYTNKSLFFSFFFIIVFLTFINFDRNFLLTSIFRDQRVLAEKNISQICCRPMPHATCQKPNPKSC